MRAYNPQIPPEWAEVLNPTGKPELEILPETGGLSPEEWDTFLNSRPWGMLRHYLEANISRLCEKNWVSASSWDQVCFLRGVLVSLCGLRDEPARMKQDCITERDRQLKKDSPDAK